MKKSTIIGLVVVLTAIVFVWGLFVYRHLHGNDKKAEDTPEVARLKAELQVAQKEVNDFATESRPKLWVDHDAAQVIQHLGYDYVWFFRWQNGILDGWVEFDEADGPKRHRLDFTRPTIDQWVKEGKKPVTKGSKGNILLALRQIGKTDEFDCELYTDWSLLEEKVGISQFGDGGAAAGKHKVKLESDPSFGKNTKRFGGTLIGQPFEVRVDRYVDKKAVPWVNIKLVDLPK